MGGWALVGAALGATCDGPSGTLYEVLPSDTSRAARYQQGAAARLAQDPPMLAGPAGPSPATQVSFRWGSLAWRPAPDGEEVVGTARLTTADATVERAFQLVLGPDGAPRGGRWDADLRCVVIEHPRLREASPRQIADLRDALWAWLPSVAAADAPLWGSLTGRPGYPARALTDTVVGPDPSESRRRVWRTTAVPVDGAGEPAVIEVVTGPDGAVVAAAWRRGG